MTKYLTLRLSPEDFSWVIRKAESLHMFPDDYVISLIEQARALDGLRGKEIRRKDGDPRNLDPASLEVTESDHG